MQINGQPMEMEIDTGAAVSLMSKREQQALFPNWTLRKSERTLRTCTGERMKIAGEMDVKVQFEKLTKTLPLDGTGYHISPGAQLQPELRIPEMVWCITALLMHCSQYRISILACSPTSWVG